MVQHCDRMLQVACLAGKIMLENGGEVYRAEQIAAHVCAVFGAAGCECFATPTALIVTVMDGEGGSHTLMRRITRRQTNLAKVEAVNSFSRRLAAGASSLDKAQAELWGIEAARGYPFWLTLLAAGVGAASFGILFDGSLLDFVLGFAAGLLMRALIWALSRHGLYDVFLNLIGGAVAALLGWLPGWLGAGTHWEVITISAIMLLVPGLLFTNGLRDLAAGDLVSGVSRVVEALVIAAALAGGAAAVYTGLQMAGSLTVPPQFPGGGVAEGVALKVVFAALGTLAFGVLFQVRARHLPFAALSGGLGYLVYLLVPGVRFGAVFLASVTIALLAEVCARRFKAPATLFLVAGLIPLVPGGALFQCILHLMESRWAEALEQGIHTLLVAAALAAGILVVSSLVKLVPVRRARNP